MAYRYTKQSFLKTVRDQYPAYDAVDDDTLFTRLTNAYPAYIDNIDPASIRPVQAGEPPSPTSSSSAAPLASLEGAIKAAMPPPAETLVTPYKASGWSPVINLPGAGRGRFNFDEPAKTEGTPRPAYLFVTEDGGAWYRQLEKRLQGGRWEEDPTARAKYEQYKRMPSAERLKHLKEIWEGSSAADAIHEAAESGDSFEEMKKRLASHHTWRQISGGATFPEYERPSGDALMQLPPEILQALPPAQPTSERIYQDLAETVVARGAPEAEINVPKFQRYIPQKDLQTDDYVARALLKTVQRGAEFVGGAALMANNDKLTDLYWNMSDLAAWAEGESLKREKKELTPEDEGIIAAGEALQRQGEWWYQSGLFGGMKAYTSRAAGGLDLADKYYGAMSDFLQDVSLITNDPDFSAEAQRLESRRPALKAAAEHFELFTQNVDQQQQAQLMEMFAEGASTEAVIGASAKIIGDVMGNLGAIRTFLKATGEKGLLPKEASGGAMRLGMAVRALKSGILAFATTKGSIPERAKAAGLATAYLMTPVGSSIAPNNLLAVGFDFLLNSIISAGYDPQDAQFTGLIEFDEQGNPVPGGQYRAAIENANIQAEATGDPDRYRWKFMFMNLAPIIGSDIAFSMMTRSAKARNDHVRTMLTEPRPNPENMSAETRALYGAYEKAAIRQGLPEDFAKQQNLMLLRQVANQDIDVKTLVEAARNMNLPIAGRFAKPGIEAPTKPPPTAPRERPAEPVRAPESRPVPEERGPLPPTEQPIPETVRVGEIRSPEERVKPTEIRELPRQPPEERVAETFEEQVQRRGERKGVLQPRPEPEPAPERPPVPEERPPVEQRPPEPTRPPVEPERAPERPPRPVTGKPGDIPTREEVESAEPEQLADIVSRPYVRNQIDRFVEALKEAESDVHAGSAGGRIFLEPEIGGGARVISTGKAYPEGWSKLERERLEKGIARLDKGRNLGSAQERAIRRMLERVAKGQLETGEEVPLPGEELQFREYEAYRRPEGPEHTATDLTAGTLVFQNGEWRMVTESGSADQSARTMDGEPGEIRPGVVSKDVRMVIPPDDPDYQQALARFQAQESAGRKPLLEEEQAAPSPFPARAEEATRAQQGFRTQEGAATRVPIAEDELVYQGVTDITEGKTTFWTTSLEEARAYATQPARGGENPRINVALKSSIPEDYYRRPLPFTDQSEPVTPAEFWRENRIIEAPAKTILTVPPDVRSGADVLARLQAQEGRGPTPGTGRAGQAFPAMGETARDRGTLGERVPPTGLPPTDSPEPRRVLFEGPELLKLATELLGGKVPKVVRQVKLLRGTALGGFFGKRGEIELRADLFKLVSNAERQKLREQARAYAQERGETENEIRLIEDQRYTELLERAEQAAIERGGPEEAAKVLAHEIGHVIDWLPEKMLKRGNIFGRIASFKKFTKNMLSEVPANVGEIFTKRERQNIRNAAGRQARKELGRRADKKAVNARTSQIYRDSIEAERQSRGLVTRQEILDELRPLIAWWHGTETIPKYFEKPQEMYADTLSVLLNNPEAVRRRAPKFFRMFYNYLDNKPKVRQVYDDIENMIVSGGVLAERDKRRFGGYRKHDEKRFDLMRQDTRIPDAIKTAVFDIHSVLLDKVRAAEKAGRVAPAENPRFAIEEAAYSEAPRELYMKDVYRDILLPLEKAGVNWDVFGKYLELNRDITERKNIAAPGMETQRTARDALDEMKNTLGEDTFNLLVGARKRMHQIRNEAVIDRLADAKVYGKELLDYMRDNENYATFNVTEYMNDRYGPGPGARVYRQLGTLKDIGNPGTETVLKDLSLITSANWNQAKRLTAEFLRDWEGLEEIPKKWDGKRRVLDMSTPPPKGMERLMYLEDGETRGFYVDKPIADAFKKEWDQLGASGAKLGSYLSQPFRQVFTQYRPGFWLFNLFRDFKRSRLLLPSANTRKLFRSYVRALKPAARSVFGVDPDEMTREMFKGNMLLSVENYRGLSDQDREMERLLKRFSINRGTWKKEVQDPVVEFQEQLAERLKRPPLMDRAKAGLEKGRRAFEGIAEFGERLGKVAAYDYLTREFPDMSKQELGHMIRVLAGSPDFLRRGAAYRLYNNIFLFSNAAKEGWRGDVEVLRERPGEYIRKTMKYDVLPKVIMKAMAMGAIQGLPPVFEFAMNAVSDYDSSNYDIVPLGTTENGKAVVLRLPKDESGRFWGGIANKILNADKNGFENLAQILDYGAGQLPNQHPIVSAGNAWRKYLAGQNPEDPHTGYKIIQDPDVFAERGTRAFQTMAEWTWNAFGSGAGLHRFKSDRPEDIKSELEEMLDVPFISDTIGRFIKVTDKGLREKGEKVLEPVAQAEATQRIEVKTAAGKTAGLLLDLARQKITEDEAREKMKTLYTDAETQAIAIDALTGKGYFDKRLEAAIVRGGGTATLKMLEGAKSKAQEMTLLQYILGGEAPLPPEDPAFFWQPAFWNSETTNDKKSP